MTYDETTQRAAAAILLARQRASASVQSELWTPQSHAQRAAIASKADELFYGGAAGGGKALAISTPIATTVGWKKMGDLIVGDCVFGANGQPTPVVAVSDVMYDRPTYTLVFDSGARITADADHLWHTWTDSERTAIKRRTAESNAARRAARPTRGTGARPDVAIRNSLRAAQRGVADAPTGQLRTTRTIADTLFVSHGVRVNHSIDVAAPLVYPQATLPIDPYVLGVWLGDGSTYKGELTCAEHDRQIIDEVEQVGYVTKRRDDLAYGVYELLVPLRTLGVLANKHIPATYLRSSYEQRLAIVQGLMDTDGTINAQGQCEFDNTNERIIKGMRTLLRSLGIKATINERRATLYGRDCGPAYRLKWTTTLPMFRLERKRARLPKTVRATTKRHYIVWAEQTNAPVPVRCIQVAAADGMFLAGKSLIPTHNSDLLLGLALTQHYKSLLLRREFPQMRAIIERSRDLLAATKATYNEAQHFWRNIPAPRIRRADGTIFHQPRTVEFGNCKLEQDKNKYQGRDHGLKGFDELPQFTRTQYTFIIGWTRATNPYERWRVVATGNPPLTAEEAWVVDYFGPWLSATYKGNGGKAKPGELRWFAQIDGKDTEVDAGAEFHYKGLLIRPRSRTFLPARLSDNPVLLQRGYADVLNAMPEPLRSLLLFGDYDASYALQDDPWQVIPSAWVDAAIRRGRALGNALPAAGLTRIAADSATVSDRFIIAKLYGDVYDDLLVQPGSSTPDGIAGARAIAEAMGLDPNAIRQDDPTGGVYGRAIPINIDILGGGSDVATILRANGFTVYGIHGNAASHARDSTQYFSFVNLRAEMYWQFREALDPTYGEGICLPDDDELREELLAPRWVPTVRGIQIEDKVEIRKRLGRSPDKADAVVMARVDMAARMAHAVPTSHSTRAGGVGGVGSVADMATILAQPPVQPRDTRRDKRKQLQPSPSNPHPGFGGPRVPPGDPYGDGRLFPQTQSVSIGPRPIPVRGPDGEVRYIMGDEHDH